MSELKKLSRKKTTKKVKKPEILDIKEEITDFQNEKIEEVETKPVSIDTGKIKKKFFLKMENGILKEIEEEDTELKKGNWDYRTETADGKFLLIDYDKDQARPYVKALLAKVNKLKEVKMLWAVLIFMLFSYFTFVVLHSVTMVRIGEIDKRITAIQSAPKQSAQPIQKINDPILDSIGLSEEVGAHRAQVEEEVKSQKTQRPIENQETPISNDKSSRLFQ